MYYIAMQEILDKANSLGIMITGSDVYINFHNTFIELNNNPESQKLFDECRELNRSISEREINGDIIESFERADLAEMLVNLSDDELIVKYLKAEKEYASLLMKIQDSLGDIREE